MRASQLLGLAIALATSTMANPLPVPQIDTNKAAGLESPSMELDGLQDVEARGGILYPTATASSGCTTIIPTMPRLTWGPTQTFWTTTTTVTKNMDCGSCNALTTLDIPIGVPPVIFFQTSITVAEPSTTTVFACAASTAAPANTVTGGPEHTPSL